MSLDKNELQYLDYDKKLIHSLFWEETSLCDDDDNGHQKCLDDWSDHQHLNGVNCEVFDKEVAAGEEDSTEDCQEAAQEPVSPASDGSVQDHRTVAGEHNIILIIIVHRYGVTPDPGVGNCQGVSPASANCGIERLPSVPLIFFIFNDIVVTVFKVDVVGYTKRQLIFRILSDLLQTWSTCA